jgi:hypothetical protein
MATRSSIKRKQQGKLGAVGALAAGGVALSADAGSNGALDFSANPALEAAFRLLEEGQLQALSSDLDASDDQRVKLSISPAGMQGGGNSQDIIVQQPITDVGDTQAVAPAEIGHTPDTMAMAPGQAGDIILAQAETGGGSGGSGGSGGGGGGGGGGGASGASGAAGAGVGTLAPVAVGPLAGALGFGAVAANAIDQVTGGSSNNGGGTAGSDLNDDQDGANSNQAFEASSFNVSGSTNDDQNVATDDSSNVNTIGRGFLDDSFGSFWS